MNNYKIELDRFNNLFVNKFQDTELNEVLNYSIHEGKRLRPIFLFKTYEMLSNKKADATVFNYAIALELIHNYSLIHDDLPSMDNDDYRRGRMTVHKKYGENIAILAGDALLNYAYEILFKEILKNNSINKIKAANYISNNSGIYGMIGGQAIDVLEKSDNLESLKLMYDRKTCGLIKAATKIGALLAGCSDELVDEFEQLGFYIGMAFQIQDDLLDYENDEKICKKTYITFNGPEKSKNDMLDFTHKAINILSKYDNELFLTETIKSLIKRKF